MPVCRKRAVAADNMLIRILTPITVGTAAKLVSLERAAAIADVLIPIGISIIAENVGMPAHQEKPVLQGNAIQRMIPDRVLGALRMPMRKPRARQKECICG